MAAPSNNGISDEDEAIEDFDMMIYLNFPPSPLHIPTLSPPRPFLPSSNSMVLYQPSNQPVENLPQNEQQEDILDLYSFLQLQMPQQQQQWIFSFPKDMQETLLLLRQPVLEESLLQLLQRLVLVVKWIFSPPEQLPEQLSEHLVRHLVRHLRLQLQHLLLLISERQHQQEQQWIFSLPKQMQKPPQQQGILSQSNMMRGMVLRLCEMEHELQLLSQKKQQQQMQEPQQGEVSEATVDVEVGIGIGAVGTGEGEMEKVQLNSGCSGKGKEKVKTPEGERGNNKTTEVRIAIPLEDIPQTKGVCLKDATMNLNVSRSEQLNPDTLPSDQALAATIDTNSVVVKEIVAPLFLPIARQENLDEDFGNGVEAVGMGSERTGESETEDGQLNSWYLGKGKRKKMTPRGERRNKKTNGVRMTKEMHLKDPAKHLKVSKPKLKTASRDYGIQRWSPRQKQELIRQSYPNKTSVIVDEEGISQLNYDALPSDQPLAATVDTNGSVVIKIHPPQFLPKARQENPDEDFGNYEVEVVGMGEEGTREGEMKEDEDFGNYEVEAVGMGVEGTGEGEMEEGQLNSGCLGKGKSIVETPRGDRGNKKTNGVKIAISFEDILQAERMYLEETGKQMSLDDAAKKFKVSRSTLKRVCRKYGILSWPPSKGNENISQSHPKESPAVVDHQEGVQQLNCEILPSDRALAANVDTNSVVLKARWVDDIIVKIRLPKPWKMAELEQQVKKRLKLESGTYYIRYKDEENELITILCDEDLEEYISSSRPLDTSSIKVFLVPK